MVLRRSIRAKRSTTAMRPPLPPPRESVLEPVDPRDLSLMDLVFNAQSNTVWMYTSRGYVNLRTLKVETWIPGPLYRYEMET